MLSFLFLCVVKQVLYVNVKEFCNLIEGVQIWLNNIVAPFTNSTCRFFNLFCQPLTGFVLFCENCFESI